MRIENLEVRSENYFSGFCLKGEKKLFDDYLIKNDFTISGFSYGAQKALNAAIETLEKKKRVDLIQLFSPAFFNDKDEKFKRMQLMFFKKDSDSYCENFLNNTSYPCALDDFSLRSYFVKGSFDELKELLYYEWDEKKLQRLVECGVGIEVFLGGNDKIIDSIKAKEFFVQYATVYFVKDAGHVLKF